LADGQTTTTTTPARKKRLAIVQNIWGLVVIGKGELVMVMKVDLGGTLEAATGEWKVVGGKGPGVVKCRYVF
jgi:hypothetical protein